MGLYALSRFHLRHLNCWRVSERAGLEGGQPMKSELDKFKTRWRRWLGNKTRANRPDWVTLLDSNWLGWVDQVMGEDSAPIGLAPRETVKAAYLVAINRATMSDLQKLDALYAQ